MFRPFRLFPVVMCLGSPVYAANPQPTLSVEAVSGRLVDERTGQWGKDEIFAPAFVPFNRLSTPLLLTMTVDLGIPCVLREPNVEERRAIAKGERQPPPHPISCDKPLGQLTTVIKYGDGKHDKQTVELSRFFSAFDGKVYVPMLFYRRLPCQPIELTAWTSAQKKPLVRRVEFRCAE